MEAHLARCDLEEGLPSDILVLREVYDRHLAKSLLIARLAPESNTFAATQKPCGYIHHALIFDKHVEAKGQM